MEIIRQAANQLEKQLPKQQRNLSTEEQKCLESAKGTRISQALDVELRQLLIYLFNLTGLNTDRYPDKLQMVVLNDFIRSTYGNDTLDEIKLAFQMAISGKLELKKDFGHYQFFSSAYFGEAMAAYRVWASQVHDYSQRSTQAETKQIEAAPIEMPDDEYINATFRVFKALRRYEAIPENVYFILEKQKKIDLTNEQKQVIKAQVMDKLNTDLQHDEKFQAEYNGMADKKGYIQGICRRCAVARYFNGLIIGEKTNEL